MSAGVERRRGTAVKSYAGRRALAARLVRATESLVAAGVPTPPASLDPAEPALHYPWIEGTPGGVRLVEALAGRRLGGRADAAGLLEPFFRPLVRLHAVAATGLDLAPLDVWRRVRERLDRLDPLLAARARGIRQAVATALADADFEGSAPVHGDFHVGQVIFDETAGRVWLLDLDDMAKGPFEFDVANFAAHLATRRDLSGDAPGAAFRALVDPVAAAYRAAGGTPPDPRLLRLFGAAALLRRALKLAERGEDRAFVLAALDVARDLALPGAGAGA